MINRNCSMRHPIDLYYWPTPNGWKISIALFEFDLPFETHLINIAKGDQFNPNFLKVAPNNRIPAITDPNGPDGNPISIFESGAILQYLAHKMNRFAGTSKRNCIAVNQWLMWQVGGVGPMAGQCHHFIKYAPFMDPPNDLPYAKNRYRTETARLYGVLEDQLKNQEYICGAYSIADMAVWPWASLWEGQEQILDGKPNLAAWLERVANRPAVQKGRAHYAELRSA